jgi:hypothetical protein
MQIAPQLARRVDPVMQITLHAILWDGGVITFVAVVVAGAAGAAPPNPNKFCNVCAPLIGATADEFGETAGAA